MTDLVRLARQRAAIRSDLLRVAREHGEDRPDVAPRRTDYRDHGRHTEWEACKAVVGHRSWTKLCKELDLRTHAEARVPSYGEAIKDVRRVARELGRSPQAREYEQRGRYTLLNARSQILGHGEQTIRRGHKWNRVLQLAGLTVHDDLPSRSEVIRDIRRVAKLVGRDPNHESCTYLEYTDHGEHSPRTAAIVICGSDDHGWWDVMEAIGLAPRTRARYGSITEERIRADMERVRRALGLEGDEPPSQRQWDRMVDYSPMGAVRAMGVTRWNDLIAQLGLEPRLPKGQEASC